ncbi:MAG: SAM-dependent methyltransferase [Planctomycetota bacterium]|nr:SAM-dependent methyltransferase [Planctomycetota bacterium]MDP6368785.1 SAM-dependent methyltransferase [Planctomycetota bacterium]MDP6520285.1 SAM-dependent methyltransferase [Planctomycetota bacterium]MDP6839800.1 SAM-dependent methyltransferase [Planctomycetota bacterium]
MQIKPFEPEPFPDYTLLDSGDGEKLERLGPVVLRRPDPQALWRPSRSAREWARAHLTFKRESDRGGRWEGELPGEVVDVPAEAGLAGAWTVEWGGGTFIVRPTPFKHVGLFPEQATNWACVARWRSSFTGAAPRLLNLFGYTGVASVLAARAGYAVTHLDASKTSVRWARENAVRSGLGADAMRVIVDDALAFAQREGRRGSHYAGILLDPPHYGRGPGGEKWQFEDSIAPLLEALAPLMEERAFAILSTYAMGVSAVVLGNLVGILGAGHINAGELLLREASGRALPAGFCARFSRGLPENPTAE